MAYMYLPCVDLLQLMCVNMSYLVGMIEANRLNLLIFTVNVH